MRRGLWGLIFYIKLSPALRCSSTFYVGPDPLKFDLEKDQNRKLTRPPTMRMVWRTCWRLIATRNLWLYLCKWAASPAYFVAAPWIAQRGAIQSSLDSSLSFPVASNHLRFAAPGLSVRRLWSSAVIIHTRNPCVSTHTPLQTSHNCKQTRTAARTTSFVTCTHIYAHANARQHSDVSSLVVFGLVYRWRMENNSPQHKHPVSPPVITQHTHSLTWHRRFPDTGRALIFRGQKK